MQRRHFVDANCPLHSYLRAIVNRYEFDFHPRIEHLFRAQDPALALVNAMERGERS
jgi:hypothetical protein